jgi:hypothetical protein
VTDRVSLYHSGPAVTLPLKFGVAFPIVYHTLGGFRHLARAALGTATQLVLCFPVRRTDTPLCVPRPADMGLHAARHRQPVGGHQQQGAARCLLRSLGCAGGNNTVMTDAVTIA